MDAAMFEKAVSNKSNGERVVRAVWVDAGSLSSFTFFDDAKRTVLRHSSINGTLSSMITVKFTRHAEENFEKHLVTLYQNRRIRA